MDEPLYKRDIVKPLTIIGRKQFIDLIFEIGNDNNHGYDTILLSVKIGDDYIKNNCKEYSIELAHVITILAAKYNEDIGYKHIILAADNTNNYIVHGLEIEVWKSINFQFTHNPFIKILYIIIGKQQLHSSFNEILKDVCYNQDIFELSDNNPKLLLFGLIILFKHNKLSSLQKYKERIFQELVLIVSKEYEIKPEDFLKTYINLYS